MSMVGDCNKNRDAVDKHLYIMRRRSSLSYETTDDVYQKWTTRMNLIATVNGAAMMLMSLLIEPQRYGTSFKKVGERNLHTTSEGLD